jgi:hypothetical protein
VRLRVLVCAITGSGHARVVEDRVSYAAILNEGGKTCLAEGKSPNRGSFEQLIVVSAIRDVAKSRKITLVALLSTKCGMCVSSGVADLRLLHYPCITRQQVALG